MLSIKIKMKLRK